MTNNLYFYNGDIITLDSTNSIESSMAVINGKIAVVGKDAEQLKGLCKPVDLQGKCMMPGFIDAHAHPVSAGMQMMQIQLRPPAVNSMDDILAAVKNKADQLKSGEWILGWSYDDNLLKEKRHPTRFDLDKVSPENPCLLTRTCVNIAVANTAALVAAGIKEDTPDPEGGFFHRDSSSGKITGILFGFTAMNKVSSVIPPPTVEFIEEAMFEISKIYYRNGITGVHNAGVGWDNLENELEALQNLYSNNRLKLKMYLIIRYFYDLLKKNPTWALESGIKTGFGNDMLKIGPLKLNLDGSGSGGHAAMRKPYSNNPENYGVFYLAEEDVYEAAEEIHRHGFQISLHAIGDRAVEVALNAIERAMRKKPRQNCRHRIEHCAICPPDLLKRVKNAGIVPVPQTLFIHELGDAYITNLGLDRVRWSYPVKSFMDMGIKVPGSSDYAVVTDMSPFLGISAAVNRKTRNGQDFSPEEKISINDALKMYTINSAYASFDEKKTGSIEVGKCADLIILGENPLKVQPEALRGMKVEATFINGEVVYVNKDSNLEV